MIIQQFWFLVELGFSVQQSGSFVTGEQMWKQILLRQNLLHICGKHNIQSYIIFSLFRRIHKSCVVPGNKTCFASPRKLWTFQHAKQNNFAPIQPPSASDNLTFKTEQISNQPHSLWLPPPSSWPQTSGLQPESMFVSVSLRSEMGLWSWVHANPQEVWWSATRWRTRSKKAVQFFNSNTSIWTSKACQSSAISLGLMATKKATAQKEKRSVAWQWTPSALTNECVKNKTTSSTAAAAITTTTITLTTTTTTIETFAVAKFAARYCVLFLFVLLFELDLKLQIWKSKTPVCW